MTSFLHKARVLTANRLRSAILCFLGVATLWALAGCATREKLAFADRPEQVVLQEKVSYVTHALNGMRWEYIALPGTYVAERKDDGGVYFYAPGRAIVEIAELYRNEPRLKVGGVYLPNDPSQPVQMVFAFETQVHTTSDLDKLILDRSVMTTALPAMRPGVGAGANVVGHAVAGALVGAMLEAGVGEINRVVVKDRALGERLRAARRQSPDASQASERARANE
jgi:hypothetical protein